MSSSPLVLLGILVVVMGFALRANPLPVIVLGALTTGIAAAAARSSDPVALAMAGVATLSRFGAAFNDNRYFNIAWLILPLIGLLEHEGLQARARAIISRARAATAGRLLLGYFALRQVAAAVGLSSVGGQAPMVRPLVAPMAEAAADAHLGGISDDARARIRAMAAASDNIGLFFGEDIFVAIGSVVLIVGFLEQAGMRVEALQVSLWAIPTASAAFLVHGARLLLFDRPLGRREARQGRPADGAAP